MSDHDGAAAGGPVGGSPVGGGIITFEEFRRIIARELNVEEKLVVPEASFEDTLYADSIRLVELMLRLEQQGIRIPMEEAWNVRTVEEAYTVYSRHAGQREGDAGPHPRREGSHAGTLPSGRDREVRHMTTRIRHRLLWFTFLILVSATCTKVMAQTTSDSDWPRWRGPNGNGVTADANWDWRKLSDGPKILWKVNVGMGVSNVAIQGGKALHHGGTGRLANAQIMVICLDASTGAEIWRSATGGTVKGPAMASCRRLLSTKVSYTPFARTGSSTVSTRPTVRSVGHGIYQGFGMQRNQ